MGGLSVGKTNQQKPSSKLTWQWKSTFSNRKYIFKWWMFHCYVSLLEGMLILIAIFIRLQGGAGLVILLALFFFGVGLVAPRRRVEPTGPYGLTKKMPTKAIGRKISVNIDWLYIILYIYIYLDSNSLFTKVSWCFKMEFCKLSCFVFFLNLNWSWLEGLKWCWRIWICHIDQNPRCLSSTVPFICRKAHFRPRQFTFHQHFKSRSCA